MKRIRSKHILLNRSGLIHGCWSLMFACVTLFIAGPVVAQHRLSQDDIEIRVDEDWQRVQSGGYYPIMMTVQNRGPDAELRFFTTNTSIGRYGASSPTIEKRISLAQNATTRVTLLMPVVSFGMPFAIHTEKNGRELEQLEFERYAAGDVEWPSVLVIADSQPDTSKLQSYCDSALTSSTAGGSWSGSSRTSTLVGHKLPGQLPDTWLAYTGIELVIVSAPSLVSEMEDSRRNELLRWVKTGGSLVIYDTGKLDDGINTLDKLMDWTNIAATDDDWKDNVLKNRPENATLQRAKLIDCQLRSLMFGKVMAIRDNPFVSAETEQFYAGTQPTLFSSWGQIYHNLGVNSVSWIKRHGFSPRYQSDDFLNFLNPGVQKIPTWGFIILITLFALVIGPVNYFVLRRRNKIGQLLWTTPLIALITSLLLFSWSTFANGTGSRARLRSLSMLDQRDQSMVSMTREALFSGVTPRNGLRFEPFSAVYPVWQLEDSFRRGNVNWTDAQTISGSFHQGNTRSQFMITTPRTERGRLQVGEATENGLTVNNGLEWNIVMLLVRDAEGNYFVGRKAIDAGSSRKLEPAQNSDIAAVRDRINRQKLERPRLTSSPSVSGRMSYRYGMASYSSSFVSSQFEKKFAWLTNDMARDEERGLAKSSYVAILGEPPNLDVGLTDFTTTDELHVLLGFY